MPDPGLSGRLWQRRASLAFIPSTICPEANSEVKCEMRTSATEATRSKSSLRHSHSFPNQTGHGGKESRARVKVGFLPIIGGVYKRWSWVTIIVIILCRLPEVSCKCPDLLRNILCVEQVT